MCKVLGFIRSSVKFQRDTVDLEVVGNSVLVDFIVSVVECSIWNATVVLGIILDVFSSNIVSVEFISEVGRRPTYTRAPSCYDGVRRTHLSK